MAKRRSREEEEWFEKRVAITAALLSVLLAITTILANNAGGNSSSALLQANDQWAYYDAKSIKLNIYAANLEMLRINRANNGNSAEYNTLIDSQIESYNKTIAKYTDEEAQIQQQANIYENESNAYGNQANVYNYGNGFYQIAIILAAVALLVKKKPLWFISCMIGIIGIGFSVYAYFM